PTNLRDERFETNDNSGWTRQSLCPSGDFLPAHRLPDGVSSHIGAERLRASGDGNGCHWGLESVQGFRPFDGCRSACDCNTRTDFNIVLDQHVGWPDTRHSVISNRAGRRSLLSRTPAFWSDGCFGGRVSLQCGRCATLDASATANAFYHLGGDRHCVSRDKYCGWHRHGHSWLRVLGSRRNDSHFSTRIEHL